MSSFFNPKTFLWVGGIVLLVVGILGFVGVIGPMSENSPFGAAWYFDNGENIAHTLLGLVAILAAFVLAANLQRLLVIVVGVVGLLFAAYSGFVEENFFDLAMLQNPADTLLHILVGLWALASAFLGKGEQSMGGSGMM